MNYKSCWCGDVCINGNCPIANAEELTDRSIPVPKTVKNVMSAQTIVKIVTTIVMVYAQSLKHVLIIPNRNNKSPIGKTYRGFFYL